MSATVSQRNRIAVDQLVQTVAAIGDDPSLGRFTFRATTSWQEGTRSTGTIHGFTQAGSPDTTRTEPFVLEGDEPPVLLGGNAGPNAVELVLQALGFCYAVGVSANAAARGIDLSALDVEVEGDIDVGPFLGLAGPRPGFTVIRARLHVTSPNGSDEQLQEL